MSKRITWSSGRTNHVADYVLVTAIIVAIVSLSPAWADDITRGSVTGQALFLRGFQRGFSGAIVTETGGVTTVNLYTDPEEDVNIGIRHIPATVVLGAECRRYLGVLKRFPPQVKIGFTGGN